MKPIAVLALVLLAACSTPSTVAPLAVPLQYKTMAHPAEFPSLQSCSAVSKVEVDDARDDKALGKRFVEGKSSASAAVTASNDVPAWLHAGVESALQRAGVKTASASAPVLKITIDQISTLENVLHRSGYEGRIGFSVELHTSGGAPCWKGHTDGFAENYGYAGSVENYQETLNHAVDRAMIKLLEMPDFKKALCSCG
jgi:uncharacterized lipoprotein YajG